MSGSARKISGGMGIRGIELRRTGTPFIRADGSASSWAASAPEISARGEGTSGGIAAGKRWQ